MTDTEDATTRRRLLAAVGTAAVGSLAGCPGDDGPGPPPATETGAPPSATPSPAPLEELEVVDVAEEGASRSGDEPIGDVIEPLLSDGRALYFPPGEYLMDDVVRRGSFEDLALVGEDATIRPVDGYDDALFALGGDGEATGLTVRGLEFDVSAEGTGVRPIHARVDDRLSVVDVSVVGRQDVQQDCARFDVTDEDGTGEVRRLRLPDGGDPEYPITGCYVGESHVGHLTFRDCEIAGFPDNGLYASPATGRVDVVGGRYANNDVANVRVSGPATVAEAVVTCDRSPEGFQNMRGIRLREGRNVLVDNCRIELRDVSYSDGAITFANWLEAATIRNTVVRVDADQVPGILAKSPATPAPEDREYGIRIEDVAVGGAASESAAIRLLERDGCLVKGTCVHQPGNERNGVHYTRVGDSALQDSAISVAGDPVVLDDASVRRRNVETRRLGDGATGDDCA